MTATLVPNAVRDLSPPPPALVFVSLFPLNLTVGGWSTTEKYLTTKICWSETNLSWLAPGRSHGYTFEIGSGQGSSKHTHICQRHFVLKNILGAANVHYSKWRIKPWHGGNILISKCSRPLNAKLKERIHFTHITTFCIFLSCLSSKHRTPLPGSKILFFKHHYQITPLHSCLLHIRTANKAQFKSKVTMYGSLCVCVYACPCPESKCSKM